MVSTGDGNDVIRFTHAPEPALPPPLLALDASDGNDEIKAIGARMDVNAGPGDDAIYPDTSRESARVDGDRISGGAGVDSLVQEGTADGRTGGWTATLDGTADDGGPGEGDNFLPDLENVEGTNNFDLLVGNSSENHLDGKGSGDTIRGLDGDDLIEDGFGFSPDLLDGGPGNDQVIATTGENRLIGGTGTDSLAGGNLNDLIEADDGKRDQISCGEGPDVAIVDSKDVVSRDPASACEVLRRAKTAKVQSRSLRAKRGKIAIAVACPSGGAKCAGKVVIARGKTKVATGRYRVPAGKKREASAKLTPRGRALLRRDAPIRVTVELRPQGGGEKVTKKLRLRG